MRLHQNYKIYWFLFVLAAGFQLTAPVAFAWQDDFYMNDQDGVTHTWADPHTNDPRSEDLGGKIRKIEHGGYSGSISPASTSRRC